MKFVKANNFLAVLRGLMLLVTGGYAAAGAVMTDASTATVIGNTLELEGETGSFDVETMEYCAFLSGEYEGYYLTYTPAAPLFPLTMTKAAETGTSIFSFFASSQTAFEVFTPSATEPSSLKISSIFFPRPIIAPTV